MALTMGGAMGLVMLAWMLNMYKSVKANIAVATASVLLLAGGIALDRSQITVDDAAWMNAMIPTTPSPSRVPNAHTSGMSASANSPPKISALGSGRALADSEWLTLCARSRDEL